MVVLGAYHDLNDPSFKPSRPRAHCGKATCTQSWITGCAGTRNWVETSADLAVSALGIECLSAVWTGFFGNAWAYPAPIAAQSIKPAIIDLLMFVFSSPGVV